MSSNLALVKLNESQINKAKEIEELKNGEAYISYTVGCDAPSSMSLKGKALYIVNNKKAEILKKYDLSFDLYKTPIKVLQDIIAKNKGYDEDVTELEPQLFSYGGWEAKGEMAERIIEKALKDFELWCEVQHEAQKEKERQAKIRSEKAEVREKEAFENELLVFGTELLSSVNHQLLHSLGAKEDTDGNISIYTTINARDIPNANTTYSIKEDIKAIGCKWNKEEKKWQIEATEENWQKVIELLQKYDTKANPRKIGMVQCWECGCWFKYRRGCEDGGGFYCGC